MRHIIKETEAEMEVYMLPILPDSDMKVSR